MTVQELVGTSTMQMLPNGKMVTIRPLAEGDRWGLLAFGAALPQDDLLAMEHDLSNAEVINRLVNAYAAENWRQIVAVIDGAIVGYGVARQMPSWFSHVAEIALVVDQRLRRSGLGRLLTEAIFGAARDLGTDKVIVKVLEEQAVAWEMFKRLGFCVEGRLHDHACDRQGRRHTLLILASHMD